MGLKNTQGILLDPDSPEAQQQQQQTAQQELQIAAMKDQADLQKQLMLKQADYAGKTQVAKIPSLRLNFDNLPLATQMQIINNATAGTTTIQDVVQHYMSQNQPPQQRQAQPPQQGVTPNGL